MDQDSPTVKQPHGVPGAIPRVLDFASKADISKWFLSGAALKWIAIVCMVIDHFAAIVLYDQYLSTRSQDLYQTYYLLRQIGRVTFPIFCFELVEGVRHTRSMPKYALRLFLFALVSEIPYDLALHATDKSWLDHLNVIFTLLFAFLPLWATEEVAKRAKLPWWASKILAAALIAGTAYVCNTYVHPSYSGYGIWLVGVLYLGKESRLLQLALASYVTILHGNALQNWCIVGLAIACLLYSGRKGRINKWVFYIFYPAHLLIFAYVAGNLNLGVLTRLFC